MRVGEWSGVSAGATKPLFLPEKEAFATAGNHAGNGATKWRCGADLAIAEKGEAPPISFARIWTSDEHRMQARDNYATGVALRKV